MVIVTLHRVHAAMEAAFNAALAEVGLSAAQWDILRLLHHSPGASGADIARYARVTPQAVTTMLRRLEKAGLLRRQAANKGRAVGSYLSPRGEAALREGDRIAAQSEAQVTLAFTPDQQARFQADLERCLSVLDSGLDPGGQPE
ncbi:MarR family winged helix-turn-helix transcriptional regulator [Nodosilinea sp. PGN35]|uniref:MarR family winged helix-turn-helix transcriptional regulator n=1 Tax=Nodosilinea sp. PGN35 TaxID=3020489 RepID=UPI0024144358|nr:MarR family transcriptional regulator [Nodosilinea sp. TSF1-S3]